MKAKHFFVALMLMISISSFAQSSNTAKIDGLNTIYLQWNPSEFYSDKGCKSHFDGLSIGYNKAFSITQCLPLYFEVGLGAQVSAYSDDITWDVANDLGVTPSTIADFFSPSERMQLLSAKLPVSFAYAFRIDKMVTKPTVTIIPFVGLDMRFNIIGKLRTNYNLTSAGVDWLKQNGFTQQQINEAFKDKDNNVFNKNDMGSDAATWNRFQVGWHIGINVCLDDKVILGVSGGTDFSEIAEKVKIHTTSLTLGYCF